MFQKTSELWFQRNQTLTLNLEVKRETVSSFIFCFIIVCITQINFSGEIMGSNFSAKLEAIIKQKVSQEEIMALLKEISDDEQDQQFNSLRVS